MFHIGVLIAPPIQLLDIAPIDLFAMCTRSYLAACKFPPALISAGIPDSALRITYISLTGEDSIASTTAFLGLHINAGLHDACVAPGELDLLMIPGPPPGVRPEEEVLEFVKRHVEKGVELMTVCSGVFVAGYAGVLDGRKATGTRGVMNMLEKEFPNVTWVDKRYTRDGRIWSSGGVTNGMDLAAVYLREKWPQVADTVLAMADVDVRPEGYEQSKVGMYGFFGWQIVKAWLRGFFGGKSKTV
ncbi:class I glutamine amidotransferase-like protein [Sporormia fimetaria CBS 119925]|uniref:Class I glutamine amidotransferase-like protein n=1 Tax=Sporormia fimetaria CBS 119925 TaxID=1340428 RepID=A0A6A6UVR2_9PLEO|nr:class I glutamine amidotransferase-like protein [Sporormia fimetaria CBS 119925]